MEDAKLAILTDAKQEYSHHLSNVLKTPLYKGLKSLYDEAGKKCQKEERPDEVLSEFQNLLSEVRFWSQEMIEREYERIAQDSQCDFIKELVTAVFMSHTQILQFIRSNEKKQTKLDIPKPEHFIHKCYINSAREFWKDPYCFYENESMRPSEIKKNIREAESIISNCIDDTIRQLLPFRHILKTYLQDGYNEDELDAEERNEPMTDGLSKTYQNNLREIIKSEIANYTSSKESSASEIKDLIDKELKSSEDDVLVAETSPKTLTEKINTELKEIKKEQEEQEGGDNLLADLEDALNDEQKEDESEKEELSQEEKVAEEFVEAVPDISLAEIASLAENQDSETEDESPLVDLDIDLEEVKTPQPGDNLAFDFSEVDLDRPETPKVELKEEPLKKELKKELKVEESVPLVGLKEVETVGGSLPVELKEEPRKEELKKEDALVEESKKAEDPEVKKVELETDNKSQKNDKMENLVVEKENPFKEVTDISDNNAIFDPNFDLDGEVNLWEDANLGSLQAKPEKTEVVEEPKETVDIGPKKFKFFSRT